MKFVHIADMHLDMPFVSLRGNKELIKKKKMEQRFVFQKVINYINENKIDILFASGDLFEQKFVTDDTISFLISSFKNIPNTKVFITPGNHDPLIKSSAYNTQEWPENVFIFGKEVGMYEIQNINVYGFGFEDYEYNSNELETLEVDKSKVNILIAHGTLNGGSKKYQDIPEKWLEKFDYVAFGHIHMPKIDNSKIIYPGSLTSCGFDELGVHGMVVGEIKEEALNEQEIVTENRLTSDLVSYKFLDISDMDFEIINLDISKYSSTTEALNELKIENNIYRIVLNGIRNLDVAKLIEEIKLLSDNIVEVIDNTRNDYNLEQISHENTLKGVFAKKMLEELDNNSENQDEINKAIECVFENL